MANNNGNQQNRPNRDQMITRPLESGGSSTGQHNQKTDNVSDDRIEKTINMRLSEGYVFKANVKLGPNENLLIFER